VRVFVEEANGHNADPGVSGHPFLDVTDKPMPTVQASRPVSVELRPGAPPRMNAPTTRPPYRVPTMAEIRAMPWNGYKVASTFSGGGGSSTGYKMAGFRVVWASEFIPAAQETYRANHPDTILDARDIRTVTAADVLRATGLREGELDLFDGSPPCASFSTAGKREAGWGTVKNYSDTKQRTDDLFFEFSRLLRGLRPKVFVAENVSGLVKGTAKGYFKLILADLKDAGYRVEAKVLDAQWLGVPQARQRLIFVGVRDDLRVAPAHPGPLPYRYSVRDALPWLTSVVHDTSGDFGAGEVINRPSPANTNGVNSINSLHFKALGAAVETESDISRYAIGREWDNLKPGEQSDKFFSLVRPSLNEPSPCVTQLGGNASVAGVTHPTERRKFSIAELKRICGFPDDYVLTGSYAQQWERCGRAVPPVMMMRIAATIRDRVLPGCR
jgi:DNA (cytosine-5)-methyltransferase 1